jgi:hypothetical protein
MICGDFNMIYRAQEKNNDRVWFITEVALKEVCLESRLYTCSNERSDSTLKRIDISFISIEWDLLFPGHELMSTPSLCSDHAPLLLRLDSSFAAKKRFMFWSF